MTLAQLPAEIQMPGFACLTNPLQTRTGVVLDVEDEGLAVIFQVSNRAAGKDIITIGVMVNTVTSSGTVDARIETVVTGEPSGTLATTNSNKSQTVSSAIWNEFVLTAPHTVAAGDVLAVVLRAAAPIDGTLGAMRNGLAVGTGVFPYQLKDSTGLSWVKSNLTGDVPTLAVEYDDNTWERIPGVGPIIAAGLENASATGTTEIGLRFQIPFAGRLASVSAHLELDGDGAIVIGSDAYEAGDTGATRLSTTPLDTDARTSTSTQGVIHARLATPVELAANTTYRVLIKPDGAPVIKVNHGTVPDPGLLEAIGVNSEWRYITWGGAAWAETSAKIPMFSLGFDQLEDGTGGGGLSMVNQRRNSMIGR